MISIKNQLCFSCIVCFLTALLYSNLWAEEKSRKRASDQLKTENQQEQAPIQRQPQIFFDSNNYDAGEVWEGDDVVHTFMVKNTGTAQLTINKVEPG